MVSPRILIIRTDASVAIGTGHVIRCLALAQVWQDQGGEAVFAMANSTPALDEYLRCEHLKTVTLAVSPGSVEDSLQLMQIANERGAEWVVVDGYQFSSAYQRAIKQAGLKLLLVDDAGETNPYCADVVVNQNITAFEELYSEREPYTTLLLGTGYVMLRREFERRREWQRSFPSTAQTILCAIGGTDPEALTLPLVKALTRMHERNIQIVVVVGGSNPCIADLQRAAKELGSQVRLLTNVRDMAAVMAESDVAVLCGGGTLWEALYMGCATISYSRPGVQQKINEKLAAASAISDLGLGEHFDEATLRSATQGLISSVQRRHSMALEGRRLVDGRGASRVIDKLRAAQ